MARDVVTKEWMSSQGATNSGAHRLGIAAVSDIAASTLYSFLATLVTRVDSKAGSVHNHAGSDINSGTVGVARLGSGTPSSSTYLRGDQTWASLPTGTSHALLSTTHTDTDSADTPANGDVVRRVSGTWEASPITDSNVASANKDGAAGTASMRTLGTGAQQAAAGNDSRLTRVEHIYFGQNNATLTTQNPGNLLVPIMDACTVTDLRARVKTAPGTQAINVTISKVTSGGTVTSVGTVSIAAAGTQGNTSGLSVSLSVGDSLRCDVTQVGAAGNEGAYLVCGVRTTA